MFKIILPIVTAALSFKYSLKVNVENNFYYPLCDVFDLIWWYTEQDIHVYILVNNGANVPWIISVNNFWLY